MAKRELIEALAPLADDTEILIPDGGTPREMIEYFDDRKLGYNEVRLYGHTDKMKMFPYKILGVDPFKSAD